MVFMRSSEAVVDPDEIAVDLDLIVLHPLREHAEALREEVTPDRITHIGNEIEDRGLTQARV
jgi:hypothetical protein